MKRMTQILSLGLLLSISSVALAGQGNGRNDHQGYYGGQHNNTHQNDRNNGYRNNRDNHRGYSKHGHGNRHYTQNYRYARRHTHQGRYCYAWHPYGYVAPRVRYGYSNPGLVIVYQPSAGLYIGGGH